LPFLPPTGVSRQQIEAHFAAKSTAGFVLTFTAATLQPDHPPDLSLLLGKITRNSRQKEAGEDAVKPTVS